MAPRTYLRPAVADLLGPSVTLDIVGGGGGCSMRWRECFACGFSCRVQRCQRSPLAPPSVPARPGLSPARPRLSPLVPVFPPLAPESWHHHPRIRNLPGSKYRGSGKNSKRPVESSVVVITLPSFGTDHPLVPCRHHHRPKSSLYRRHPKPSLYRCRPKSSLWHRRTGCPDRIRVQWLATGLGRCPAVP